MHPLDEPTMNPLLNVGDRDQHAPATAQSQRGLYDQSQRGIYAPDPLTGREYFGSPTQDRRGFASARLIIYRLIRVKVRTSRPPAQAAAARFWASGFRAPQGRNPLAGLAPQHLLEKFGPQQPA